ncbi:MAG: hydroxyethylthiazole kinase [Clostridiales bacterium]|nr:hydroxyethylthiazole kinase [Clostridiales bacterium]
MNIGKRFIEESLEIQKRKCPLIHCISNSLGIKDLLKGILGYCGIPLISNTIEEIEKLTYEADCLLINTDSLTEQKVNEMERAIRIAFIRGIPIVLDISEVNLSFLSKETVLGFIGRYNVNVVKGTLEEFISLLGDEEKSKLINKESKIKDNLNLRVQLRSFSRKQDLIVVAEADDYYITDGFSEFYIEKQKSQIDEIARSELILSGLIAVGISSSNQKEQRIKGVLVAAMAITTAKKILEEKGNKKNKLSIEGLLAEIENIKAEKINKYSKISYLFVR